MSPDKADVFIPFFGWVVCRIRCLQSCAKKTFSFGDLTQVAAILAELCVVEPPCRRRSTWQEVRRRDGVGWFGNGHPQSCVYPATAGCSAIEAIPMVHPPAKSYQRRLGPPSETKRRPWVSNLGISRQRPRPAVFDHSMLIPYSAEGKPYLFRTQKRYTGLIAVTEYWPPSGILERDGSNTRKPASA